MTPGGHTGRRPVGWFGAVKGGVSLSFPSNSCPACVALASSSEDLGFEGPQKEFHVINTFFSMGDMINVDII